MLNKMLEEQNVQEALEYLSTKKQSSFGIDGMPLSELPRYYEANRETLRRSILSGTYAPQAVILSDILTPKGKIRTIAKYTSIDRLLLRTIHQQMEKVLVPTFSTHSFAFQDGKGTLDAVKAAAQFVSEGQTWVVGQISEVILTIFHTIYFCCVCKIDFWKTHFWIF